jgi:hypothetical protein
MAIPVWHVGDTPRLQCYFYVNAALTDPTAVSLLVQDPSGTQVTYTYAATVSKTGTGDYYKDVNVGGEGTWKWRWVGTGTCPATEEGEFEVKRSEFV